MGKRLTGAGALHVVCWQSEMQDDTAREFALQFYASLNEQDPSYERDEGTTDARSCTLKDPSYERDYRHAFLLSSTPIGSGSGATRAPKEHLAAGAVDCVCLLSESVDRFPDTGHRSAGPRQRLLQLQIAPDTGGYSWPRPALPHNFLLGESRVT